MLKDSLYIIQKIAEENNFVEAVVELNAKHEIFEGHFPGQPVLPGACMLQMVREILENFLNKKLQLSKADDIRFLVMVDPSTNKELKFILEHNSGETQQVNVNAKILNIEDVVCCKMKLMFKWLP